MAETASKSWQEAGNEFHMMMGECIAEWARVEEVLFQIFHACVKCSAEHASIIYYKTPTLDSRLTLIDEIIKTVLPKRSSKPGSHDHMDVTCWKNILKITRDLMPIRNWIAHHPVNIRFSTGHFSIDEMSFTIYASSQERLRPRGKAFKRLTINDLRDHLKKTNALTGRLHDFLRGPLATHVSSYAPQGALP
jgi:hypothetical protein